MVDEITATSETSDDTGPGTAEKALDVTKLTLGVIVNELKRRAVAAGMTTEELLKQAQVNWNATETEAEDLKNRV